MLSVKNSKKLFAFIFACVVFPLSTAYAENEIVVKDVAGNTRANSIIDGQGLVNVSVSNPKDFQLDKVNITLVNETSSTTLTQKINQDGIINFAPVAPGIWTLASDTPGVKFASVYVVDDSDERRASPGVLMVPSSVGNTAAGAGVSSGGAGGASSAAVAAGAGAAGASAGIGITAGVLAVGVTAVAGAVAIANSDGGSNSNSTATSDVLSPIS
ncbi:MAG: hypothetical protein KDD56_10705 [Bdellovibrionales bacterium]|nr:hypothetical protein [Bdellovibrionales bacterium]